MQQLHTDCIDFNFNKNILKIILLFSPFGTSDVNQNFCDYSIGFCNVFNKVIVLFMRLYFLDVAEGSSVSWLFVDCLEP